MTDMDKFCCLNCFSLKKNLFVNFKLKCGNNFLANKNEIQIKKKHQERLQYINKYVLFKQILSLRHCN